MTSAEREGYEAEVLRLRAGLDAAAFDDAWAAGHGLSAEEAVALALSD
jgi:hypothetical protein